MEYSVKLYIDSSWTPFSPLVEGLEFEAFKESPAIERIKAGGKLMFLGSEYNFLKGKEIDTYQIDCRITETFSGSTYTFECILNIRDTFRDDEAIFEGSVAIDDRYISMINGPSINQGTKFNMLNTDGRYIVYNTKQIWPLTFIMNNWGGAVSGYALFATLADDPSPVYTDYFYAKTIRTYPTWKADELINSNGWVLVSTDTYTKTIETDWVNAGDYPAASFVHLQFYDDTTGSVEISYTHYIRADGQPTTAGLSNFDYQYQHIWGNSSQGPIKAWLKLDWYFSATPTNAYNNCRSLQDVIEYLVGEIDPVISFDSNSFNLFSDFDEELNNLYISSLNDVTASAASDLGETRGEISFKQILDWIATQFHGYWYITSIFKFRLEHVKNINFPASGLDLTITYPNFLPQKYYEYDLSKKYTRIIRKSANSNIDFVGVDIEFTQLPFVNEKSENIEFINDIWDIEEKGELITDGFIIFACDVNESNSLHAGPLPNGSIYPYSTYLSTDSEFSAINTGGAGCVSDQLPSLLVYDLIKITCTLTINSGDPPRISIVNDVTGIASAVANVFPIVAEELNYTLSAGANEVIFQLNSADGAYYTQFYNISVGAYDFVITNIVITHVKRDVRHALGALTNTLFANVELSIANTDAKYIAETTEHSGTVNGAVKNNMFKNVDKIGKTILFPYQDNFNSFLLLETFITNIGECIAKNHKRKLDNSSFDELEVFINDNDGIFYTSAPTKFLTSASEEIKTVIKLEA